MWEIVGEMHVYDDSLTSHMTVTEQTMTQAQATAHGTSWRSDVSPPCLGGSSHGWVPVDTNNAPVLPKGRKLWVAHSTEPAQA